MRKGVILLVAALLFSLAAPAFAAVEVGGKLGSKFTLERVADKWQVRGNTGLEVETSFTADGGNPVKAVVQLEPWNLNNAGFDDDGNPIGEFDMTGPDRPTINPLNATVKKAWIETAGAYWNGGPTVSTRIGDVTVSWDDYIGHVGDRAGVTVEGFELGPVSAKAFYAWDKTKGTRPMGVSVAANIEGIDVDGLIVRGGGVNNISLGAGAELIPGTSVSGRFALDGASGHLYRVQAESEGLVPGVKLIAGYRGAKDFDPIYPRMHDEDGNELWDKLTGFNVGVETTQSGITVKADYDNPKNLTKVAASTEIEGFTLSGSTELKSSTMEKAEVKVGRNFILADFDVAGEYKAELKKGETEWEHTLKASTKTDMIPYLQGLGLSGEVSLKGGAFNYAAGADYAAPNGIEFGAKYESKDNKGLSATAGVTVKF